VESTVSYQRFQGKMSGQGRYISLRKFTIYLIVLFIFFTFFQDLLLYFHKYDLSLIAKCDLFDEIIFSLIVFNVIFLCLSRSSVALTPIDIFIVCFLLYFLFLIIYQEVPLEFSIFSIRDTFYYVMFFYIFIQIGMSRKTISILVKWLFRLAWIQFVILLVQWALYVSETGSFFIEDAATGFMGPSGAHKLGYFSGTLLLAYTGLYRYKVVRNRVIFLVLMSTIVITSSRSAFLYLPVALSLLFLRDMWKSWKKFFIWFSLIFACLVAFFTYQMLADKATMDPVFLYHQQSKGKLSDGSYTRFGFLKYTWDVLSDNDAIVMGLGPGFYLSKTAKTLGSPSFRTLESDDLKIDTTKSQMALTFGEYGLLGCFIVLGFYLKLYIYAGRIIKIDYLDPFLYGMAFATRGMIIYFLMCTFSNNIFEIQQVAILPWLFGAFTVILKNKINNSSHISSN
jgi:hypothetical protein